MRINRLLCMLLFIYSNSLFAETYEFWLVGNYPILDSMVYGMGEEDTIKIQDKLSSRNGNKKYVGYMGFLAAGTSGLSGMPKAALTFGTSIAILYAREAQREANIAKLLESREQAVAYQLTLELSQTTNGQEFIDKFGKIANIRTDFYGKIEAFISSKNYVFERTIEEDGVTYYKAKIGTYSVNVFIEPNMN